MKAKHIPRIDIHDRLELKEALPLRTPYVIYIDPCDTCNFRCKFCPSGNLELMKKTKGRGHGPMDFEVYKRIIDSLGDFPDKVRVVRLYKEGEPLLNPRFADMVRYAKESGHCLRVDTTTNASLLTPEKSLEIIDAGLDRLNISVEGVNAEQYRKIPLGTAVKESGNTKDVMAVRQNASDPMARISPRSLTSYSEEHP